MNQKQPYRSDRPGPEYLYEVKVGSGTKTYLLAKGMEVTVSPATNRPSGRHRFEYAERTARGELLLYIYGPTRRKNQRVRMITPAAIKTVHIKTVGPCD